MSSYFGWILAAALVVLTAGSAWHHGQMTNRWVVPEEMVAAGKRMGTFPEQFGDWKLLSTEELSPGILSEFNCQSYYSHTYLNRVTGEQVNVLLFLGLPGPLFRHAPEVCYSGRNTLIGEPEIVEIKMENGKLYNMRLLHYASSNTIRPRFSVLYGFNAGAEWFNLPKFPRIELGALPLLYKLQILSTEVDNQLGIPPTTEKFYKDFFPMFERLILGK
jgi:hypothetical protein